MATNVTAEFSGHGPNGVGATITSGNISVADQTVNTTPNATGGFNTATVTADVARTLVFAASDGVRPGTYENIGVGKFRLQGQG